MFGNKEAKINWLLKENREKIDKINSYLRQILSNELEIVRLHRENQNEV